MLPSSRSRWCRLSVVLLLLGLTIGCAARRRGRDLQAVARDWCEVIRASLVLPVYPLTEDLQPGDLFLVTRPIGQEASLYRKKGFLPLDQHLGRLQPLDFQGFYQGRFGVDAHPHTPHQWRRPLAPVPGGPGAGGATPPANPAPPTGWAEAPRAAFPSYSFRVKSGVRLDLALPVQGVPVGLGLLQEGSASGSITLADSYVYGVSHDELAPVLRAWNQEPERRAVLAAVRAEAGRPLYVRAVSRVYLSGRVVVALQAESAGGAEVTAGPTRGLAPLQDRNTTAAYQEVLGRLNRNLAETLPGGALTIAQASGRSVTLNETFPRPLVIGYLAFDFPILEDGGLGAPVSTLERLRTRANPTATLGELSPAQGEYHLLVCAIASRPADVQASIYDAAAPEVGAGFEALYESARGGQPPDRAFSAARSTWIRSERGAEARVTRALRAAWDRHAGNP